MARRDPSEEFWRAQRAERARKAREEEQHPAEAVGGADLDRLVAEAHSADEEARAKAVRNLCPCRIGWEGFQQGMPAVAKARKDASAEVRRQALHVFQDAFEMQCM